MSHKGSVMFCVGFIFLKVVLLFLLIFVDVVLALSFLVGCLVFVGWFWLKHVETVGLKSVHPQSRCQKGISQRKWSLDSITEHRVIPKSCSLFSEGPTREDWL